ncbi:MAG: hypothetical protein HYW23_02770 [Candidatus Aenigmarchaeota archaeon]|nr:hypothetical protein [Candidatus Aenigmarchaeota archaeon]
MVVSFFKFTLEKLVVAKLIGLPLLALDYFYRNFLTPSLAINIAILIFASYTASCIVVHFYRQRLD